MLLFEALFLKLSFILKIELKQILMIYTMSLLILQHKGLSMKLMNKTSFHKLIFYHYWHPLRMQRPHIKYSKSHCFSPTLSKSLHKINTQSQPIKLRRHWPIPKKNHPSTCCNPLFTHPSSILFERRLQNLQSLEH